MDDKKVSEVTIGARAVMREANLRGGTTLNGLMWVSESCWAISKCRVNASQDKINAVAKLQKRHTLIESEVTRFVCSCCTSMSCVSARAQDGSGKLVRAQSAHGLTRWAKEG